MTSLLVLVFIVLLAVLWSKVGQLRQRVIGLEEALAALSGPAKSDPARGAMPGIAPAAAPGLAPEPEPSMASLPAVARPAAKVVDTAQAAPQVPAERPAGTLAPSVPVRPNAVDVALRTIKRWFTTGNVPVKIGVMVLLAGVAALLKYAGDQGWLRLPIELRLAGVAAAALAALVFAWRKRTSHRSFSLAVQGGAIGTLLLTVFAAFKLYGLIGAAPAFALSVLLVAGLGVLAVLQDARALAVLGLMAGFLAPVWLSTGSGNHVALFSYYAVLNAAIFAIAWMRSWRILNLLGFAFTWGIGIAWGVLDYQPAKYASTQPFLLLFFAFYLALPVLYARRRPARSRDRIDGCLLFGTPLVAFSLQAALLDGARMPLALCALGAAAVYAVLARALIHRERYVVLGQAHALLAVGFATLAVPLALSARATASVFALEGAALVWLGLRQSRRLPQFSGVALQLAAAVAFAIAIFIGSDNAWKDAVAFANPTFMSALLLALAGFATAWAYRRMGTATGLAAPVAYLWGMAWWCGNALSEVEWFVVPEARADVLLAFVAMTGWLAAEVHRRHPARALVLTTLVGFVLAIPLAVAQGEAHAQPLAGYGALAWLAFAILGVRSLLCVRAAPDDRFAAWAQFAWWLVWPTMLSIAANWLGVYFKLASGWQLALLALPWLAMFAVSQQRWQWLAAPLGERFDRLRTVLQTTLAVVLGAGWVGALFESGSAAPLPWLPLLNPMDLIQVAVLVLAARWLGSVQAPSRLTGGRLPLLAGAGFVLVTCVTLRAVHHWGGEPWDSELPWSTLAQTALTVVWSVLGVAGWVSGSRRGQRLLWLAGAVLMGVVLAKLIVVDRGNLGNLLGIGAFIAYGLLCTLVGWLAPAPPRAPEQGAAMSQEASA